MKNRKRLVSILAGIMAAIMLLTLVLGMIPTRASAASSSEIRKQINELQKQKSEIAKQIKDTIDNTLADIPGIICDGAKASCAVKISSALDASLFAHTLAMQGKVYEANTGIIRDETAKTISSVGHIGRVGMQPTDQEIVKLMIEKK